MDRHSSNASNEFELGLAEFAKTIQCNESNRLACPSHPQGLLIDDHHTGDVICSECGLVLGEKFEVAIYTPNKRPLQQEYEPPAFRLQRYGSTVSQKDNRLSNTLDQIATFADRIHLTRDIVDSAQQLYSSISRHQRQIKWCNWWGLSLHCMSTKGSSENLYGNLCRHMCL